CPRSPAAAAVILGSGPSRADQCTGQGIHRYGRPRRSETIARSGVGQSVTESGGFLTMPDHQPDQAVFRPTLPGDIDWEPFPAFPPPARLAVVMGHPS